MDAVKEWKYHTTFRGSQPLFLNVIQAFFWCTESHSPFGFYGARIRIFDHIDDRLTAAVVDQINGRLCRLRRSGITFFVKGHIGQPAISRDGFRLTLSVLERRYVGTGGQFAVTILLVQFFLRCDPVDFFGPIVPYEGQIAQTQPSRTSK